MLNVDGNPNQKNIIFHRANSLGYFEPFVIIIIYDNDDDDDNVVTTLTV